jgi:hypothetical protein
LDNDILMVKIKYTTYISAWLNSTVILQTQIHCIILWHVELTIHHPSVSVISIVQFIVKLEKKEFCKLKNCCLTTEFPVG